MKLKLLVDLKNKKAGDVIEPPFGYEQSLISRGIAEKAELDAKTAKSYKDISGKEYTEDEVNAMDKRTNLYKEIIATSK